MRNTVESVRSLCKRDIGNLFVRCSNMALAIPKLPSAFSKSIGLTLCGMAEEPDEVCHKGMKYGTDVHEEAHLMELGMSPSGRFPESEYIASDVLSRRGMDGFIRSYSEIECTVPIIGGTTVLKGVIDLLLVFEDRIEVHDYKTDETDRFQREYEIQLSAYALAAGGFYRNLPVRCFIDYVSQGRTVEIEPMSQKASCLPST